MRWGPTFRSLQYKGWRAVSRGRNARLRGDLKKMEHMMKVLVRGLHAGVDAARLREALAAYVSVKDVELICEGDGSHPWAWVDLDLDDVDPMSVWKLVAMLDRRYIAGCHTRWHVPAYRAR